MKARTASVIVGVASVIFLASSAGAQTLEGANGPAASAQSRSPLDAREAASKRDSMLVNAGKGALAGGLAGARGGPWAAVGGAIFGGALGAFYSSMDDAVKVSSGSNAGSDHPGHDHHFDRDLDRQNAAGERVEHDVQAGRKIG